jgi:hypothetical protein
MIISRQHFVTAAFTLLLAALTSLSFAQQRGVCGTSAEADDYLADLITAQKELLAKQPIDRKMMDPIYVPIRFHPVAETSGEGRINRRHLIYQLKVLNDEFAETGFVFYHDAIDWIDLNNTTIYSNPGTSGSFVQNAKASNAVNVFVTENADSGSALGGTTLGFYSPSGDYVIIRQQELITLTNTLSHEIGHFFSLPHTHRGWDSEDYDPDVHGNPLASCLSPSGQPIELADRSNCDDAADRLCDTREDYNFGFTNPNNCVFTREIRDCNGDLAVPDVANQMGYFSGCQSYLFSEQQKDMMTVNLNSTRRNYLRNNPSYVPVTDEITSRVSEATPNTNNDEIESNRDIFVDWEDIEGATHYLVEMDVSGEDFEEYWVVTESELTIDELPAETKFNYRVYPFNETQTTLQSGRLYRFTTPAATTSTNEISELAGWEVFPSPLRAGQPLVVATDLSGAINAQVVLTGLNGAVIYSENIDLQQGRQETVIDTDAMPTGLYILSLETSNGVARQKVVVQ